MPSPSGERDTPEGKDTGLDVKEVLVEIGKLAQERKFPQAEALREKLIETDPTALTEIIRSAEIIEKEKTAGLDRDHLVIWDNLYRELNEEETNCLFYSLKKIVVPAKKRILAHGGYNTRLYFIEKGTVTVFTRRDGENKVVAQLGRGDMMGEYTFTTISLCSASVVSNSEVELRYLESSATDGWHLAHPGLYEKLTRFCVAYGQINAIESRQKQEAEEANHFSVDGIVTAHLLTKDGKKSTTYFRGGLTEIYTEGCCFEIKSSKRETARALLAKRLLLVLACNRSEKAPTLSITGKVKRVTFQLHNDYSVYVTFQKPIAEEELKRHFGKAAG